MNQRSGDKVWLIFSKLLGMDTERERERFEEMVSSGSGEKGLFDELSLGDAYQRRKEAMQRVDVEGELRRVIKSRKRVSFHSMVSWRAAAIVLPLILGGLGVTLIYEESEPTVVYVDHLNDVDPGTLGGVLVLSDGTLRELEALPNHIKEKDGSQIKVDSARLNYSGEKYSLKKSLIYNKLLIGRGHEYMLILSDGTKVWMNSKSELHYPVVFGKGSRHVRLSGEAYFEVARDSSRPFVVEVDRGFEVKVLGTHFNIKAYDTDECYETTLVEGKVEVKSSNGTGVTLKPSEQMVIGRNGKQEVRMVNTAYYIAWHEGWFYFDNESLSQVLTMIGRWYDVGFDFEDIALKEIVVTGKVKRFESLSVILDMLKRTTGVEYDVVGKMIIIRKSK